MVSGTGTGAAWQWSRHTHIRCTGHGNAKGQAEGGDVNRPKLIDRTSNTFKKSSDGHEQHD